MNKLFLDDLRRPPDSSWDVVRSYDQFVAYIEAQGCPDVISFDHDLADEHYPDSKRMMELSQQVACPHCGQRGDWEPHMQDIVCNGCRKCLDYNRFYGLSQEFETYRERTGMDCVKYLVSQGLKPKIWLCHTQNPVGYENMRGLLLAYCPEGDAQHNEALRQQIRPAPVTQR